MWISFSCAALLPVRLAKKFLLLRRITPRLPGEEVLLLGSLRVRPGSETPSDLTLRRREPLYLDMDHTSSTAVSRVLSNATNNAAARAIKMAAAAVNIFIARRNLAFGSLERQ